LSAWGFGESQDKYGAVLGADPNLRRCPLTPELAGLAGVSVDRRFCRTGCRRNQSVSKSIRGSQEANGGDYGLLGSWCHNFRRNVVLGSGALGSR